MKLVNLETYSTLLLIIKELSLGKLLVENLSSKHFDPSKHSDAYAKELEKLIESKVKCRMVVAELQKIKEEETKDLVAALKASLQKTTKVKG
jgi:DNA end-binding protein Ku